MNVQNLTQTEERLRHRMETLFEDEFEKTKEILLAKIETLENQLKNARILAKESAADQNGILVFSKNENQSDGKSSWSDIGFASLVILAFLLLILDILYLNSRLAKVEGYNIDSRVTTMEGYNIDSRLATVEGYNIDSRLASVELTGSVWFDAVRYVMKTINTLYINIQLTIS